MNSESVNVYELTRPQIAFVIANLEGRYANYVKSRMPGDIVLSYFDWAKGSAWDPCANAQQGQPIVEREKINAIFHPGHVFASLSKTITVGGHQTYCGQRGATELIARLRCYIASKCGDVVEITEKVV